MKVIYKYQIKDPHDIQFEMPTGAKILTVQIQMGSFVTIWALVDPNADLVIRRFRLIMTGEEIDDIEIDDLKYVGTVQTKHNMIEGQVIVGHLFESLYVG